MANGTLKVSNIETSSGSGTITLGASGETVDLSNGTITLNSTMKATPAFEAHLGSNQTSVANDTSVKVQFATEVFDSDGTYDNSTNYRFTPAVAGKYFVYSSVEGNGGGGNSDLDELSNQIYLNGSVYRYNQNKYTSNPVKYVNVQSQAIMDLDADDYVEIYAHIKSNSSSGSNSFSASNKKTYFGAYRIIGA